ncbi:MAG: sugar phosphate isomerase/epimerase [Planctomycetes bacterium]|nr:sugar phosphate isomerase/epimerase [Planctomycetota bacterium]
MEKWPLGIFTSVGAGLGAGIGAVKELGVPTVQLHAPPRDMATPEKAAEFKKQFDDAGIKVTVVFSGFEGESYADIPTVKKTVGLVPAETRATRLEIAKRNSDFARGLGCDALGMHVGFIPEGKSDPERAGVIEVACELCDHCAQNGQHLHLETGQETAEGLLEFIADVGKDNLAVNFDPANMILYGSGEPIEALRKVGKHVRSVHCKDAAGSDKPGETWGEEKPLGQGEVGMENFLSVLKEIGYDGALTIEREISGPEQKKDIADAIKLLTDLRAKILG